MECGRGSVPGSLPSVNPLANSVDGGIGVIFAPIEPVILHRVHLFETSAFQLAFHPTAVEVPPAARRGVHEETSAFVYAIKLRIARCVGQTTAKRANRTAVGSKDEKHGL